MKWIFVLLSATLYSAHAELSDEVSGRRTLRSSHDTYLRAWKDPFDMLNWRVDMAGHSRECEQWYIEFHGGKVALWPFCYRERYLSAERDGSVVLSSTAQYWSPLKRENGSWSFLSAHGGWLTADKNGSVYTVDKMIDSWQKFRLGTWINDEKSVQTSTSSAVSEKHQEDSDEADYSEQQPALRNPSAHQDAFTMSAEASGQRAIRSSNHRYKYLRGWRGKHGWEVDWAPNLNICEHWYIDDHRGTVKLRNRCSQGKYLQAHADNSITLEEQEWGQEWTPLKNEDGSWSFRSIHGGWLSVDSSYGRARISNNLDENEKFRLDSWTRSSPPPKAKESSVQSEQEHDDSDDYAHSTSHEHDRSDELHEEKKGASASLSAEIAGTRKLRTADHWYLSIRNGSRSNWIVQKDQATCSEWHFEEHDGKVALRPDCAPDKYLRNNMNGSVDLADHRNSHEMWTPFNNDDGSWSFQSTHGTWLSVPLDGGRMILQTRRLKEDHFWLETATAVKLLAPLTMSSDATFTGFSPKIITKIAPVPFTQHHINDGKTTTTAITTQSTSSSAELNETTKPDVSRSVTYYFIFAIILSALLAIFLVVITKFYLFSHKPKREIAVSYQNLVYEDLRP